MREIEFRGKDDESGKFVYGYYQLERDMRRKAPFLLKPSISWEEDGILFSSYIIPETLGQYTGLTDKNGTKIFEGDVIKGVAYSSEWVGTVVWINEIASFGVMYSHRTDPTTIENSSLFKALRIGMNNEYCAEVIGNIYDNPELLKEH